MYIPEDLLRIAKQVAAGERPQVGVPAILSWYGYRRRSRYVVEEIDRALEELDLGTVPHFDWTYLGASVTFKPRSEAIREYPLAYPSQTSQDRTPSSSSGMAPEVRSTSHQGDGSVETIRPQGSLDPTYRIGRLDIANRRPVSVSPDTTVLEAITLLLKQNFSQLPVMIGDRTIKGLFSWKSFGSRRSFGQESAYVREAMDDFHKVSTDDSIFRVVDLMRDYDCVLVEDETGVITGIITPYDISVTFGQLGEPFLALGEIENHIRVLIEGKFTIDELKEARDPSDVDRRIGAVADLTFGEYVRLLENAEKWEKLGLPLDRKTFVKDLEEIRRIRNDVMHFDPEGIDEDDLRMLRDFVGFLQRVQKLKVIK